MLTQIIILIALSYLIGSISPSYIFGRLIKGIDIRKYGSKNAGTVNAFIVLGKFIGILTAVIDISKGILAALIALFFNINELGIYLIGIAAVIGHNYPFYLNFKGGKGVATILGFLATLIVSLFFNKEYSYLFIFSMIVVIYIAFVYLMAFLNKKSKI